MDIAEWSKLLTAVQEIQEWFPEGVAYIGGIAVFAHASAEAATAKYAGMSHDADLMILLPDFADLRDIEALTPNRRLGKQQFSRDGFEFDVYVEGQHNLPVPADEAVAWAEMKNGLRVACAEHLLILKLKAYVDRKGTGKGAALAKSFGSDIERSLSDPRVKTAFDLFGSDSIWIRSPGRRSLRRYSTDRGKMAGARSTIETLPMSLERGSGFGPVQKLKAVQC